MPRNPKQSDDIYADLQADIDADTIKYTIAAQSNQQYLLDIRAKINKSRIEYAEEYKNAQIALEEAKSRQQNFGQFKPATGIPSTSTTPTYSLANSTRPVGKR